MVLIFMMLLPALLTEARRGGAATRLPFLSEQLPAIKNAVFGHRHHRLPARRTSRARPDLEHASRTTSGSGPSATSAITVCRPRGIRETRPSAFPDRNREHPPGPPAQHAGNGVTLMKNIPTARAPRRVSGPCCSAWPPAAEARPTVAVAAAAADGDAAPIKIGIIADLTGATGDVGKPYNEGMLGLHRLDQLQGRHQGPQDPGR
jgi:hypothetical protein